MCNFISVITVRHYYIENFSKKYRHNEAINHVKVALELLEAERNQHLIKVASENEKKKEDDSEGAKYKNIITTMIMAYYNYGTELEHIKDFNTSIKALTKGFELSSRELGAEHTLTNNIRESIQKLVAKKKVRIDIL